MVPEAVLSRGGWAADARAPRPGRQVYPNSTALVVSTENITQNWYFGNDRSMLIPNCLFRVGGAAVLLSNKRSDRRRAKCALRPPPPAPRRACPRRAPERCQAGATVYGPDAVLCWPLFAARPACPPEARESGL